MLRMRNLTADHPFSYCGPAGDQLITTHPSTTTLISCQRSGWETPSPHDLHM